jgi:lipoprotein-releasing system permease protein
VSNARLIARIALRGALHRRGLSIIAALGVALGVVALVTMNGIMQGVQGRYKDQLINATEHIYLEEDRLDDRPSILAAQVAGPLVASVSHHPARERQARLSQPRGLVRALANMDGVSAACGLLVGELDASVGSRRFNLAVRGIEPEAQDKCTPLMRFVRRGRWNDFVGSPDAILIGKKLAKDLLVDVGDRIHVRLRDGSSQSLRVAAIFETGLFSLDSRVSYVRLARAQSLLELGVPMNRIDVSADEPFAAAVLARRLEWLTGHKASSWIERAATDLAVFDLENKVVSLQIFAILLVGGFGILAVQIMMVLQKTRDISILRSVGLRRRDILAVFVMQGAMIAIVGGLVGDLGAWGLTSYMASLVEPNAPFSDTTLYIYKDPFAYVLGLGFAVVVGAGASLLPAWRASRVEPVAVLRGSVT